MTSRYVHARKRRPLRPVDPERSREQALALLLLAVQFARVAGRAAGEAIAAAQPTPATSVAPRQPALTDDHAWSVEDVGYFLGVSDSEVRKLERDGKLPALPRYCNRLLFDPKIVRAFREGAPNVTVLRQTKGR